jgi:hypothetical protein
VMSTMMACSHSSFWRLAMGPIRYGHQVDRRR